MGANTGLHRFPPTRDDTLRAWDAADDYVLDHVAQEDIAGSTCVVNDRFGALAVGLGDAVRWSWSDSSLTHEASRRNLARLVDGEPTTAWLSSMEVPDEPVDVLLIKVPKTLALLEDQLHRIRPHLHADSIIVGAGMTKMIHNSTIELFTRILGPTTTSLARRKARLIHTTIDVDLDPGVNPHPGIEKLDGLEVHAHAGVFAAGKLDRGTHLLMQALPPVGPDDRVVDLGCGTGMLGTRAALAGAGHVTFADESYGAVASARATFQANASEAATAAEFVVGDGAEPLPDESVKLVLCNPPFHAQGARVDDVAWGMFTGAKRVLEPGGALMVVGNRHLNYHAKLERIFTSVEAVSSDNKFVVLRAT